MAAPLEVGPQALDGGAIRVRQTADREKTMSAVVGAESLGNALAMTWRAASDSASFGRKLVSSGGARLRQ